MKTRQEINTQLDNLYNLMRFLKDSYHNDKVFTDVKLGEAFVKLHMNDFDLNLTDEDVSNVAFLLQPIKNK